MADRCEHTRPNGTRCQARPMGAGRFCYYHEPGIADRRAEANRQGGRASHRPVAVLPADTPDVPLASVGDVCGLLASSINRTLKGALDTKQANAVGYLSSVLLKALEGSELARELEALRQQVEALKHGNGCGGDAPAGVPTAADGGHDGAEGGESGVGAAPDGSGSGDAGVEAGTGPVAGAIRPLFE